jgi:hypothetical protein
VWTRGELRIQEGEGLGEALGERGVSILTYSLLWLFW